MLANQVYEYIDKHCAETEQIMEELVRMESWSGDRQGVNAVADYLERCLQEMGLCTERTDYDRAGSSLAAFSAPGKLPAVALMAHMDTVHRPGSFGSKMLKRKGCRLYGPGIYDCKGGIAAALLVIRALQAAGYDKRQLMLLLSGDEEVAHELSGGCGTDVYLRASGAAAAFNCESAPLDGSIVLQRRGGAVINIAVHGVAAHAGSSPQKGASAILAAAGMISEIEALTDYTGTLYNCGLIHGGQGANMVPDFCEFTVGLRFMTNSDYEEALKKLEYICSSCGDSRIHTEMRQKALFRAMEKTEKTDLLFDIYKKTAASLGFPEPQGIYAGGCSDAAYVALQGVPVLCGTGILGADNHTAEEYALPESLCGQAKKIAGTILSLPDDF